MRVLLVTLFFWLVWAQISKIEYYSLADVHKNITLEQGFVSAIPLQGMIKPLTPVGGAVETTSVGRGVYSAFLCHLFQGKCWGNRFMDLIRDSVRPP